MGFLLMAVLWECYSTMVVPAFWGGGWQGCVDMLDADGGTES